MAAIKMLPSQHFYLHPLHKLTALKKLFPLSSSSATHSLKTFDSFLIEQKLNAIATRAIAETTLELN